MSEPDWILLKIYSDPDSAPKAFDVSRVTMNSGFLRTGWHFVTSLKSVTLVRDITNPDNCFADNDFSHKSGKKC